MNKNFITILSMFIFANTSFAAIETENIKSALKASGYEPNYFSIVMSLVFVIILIYITGIIYTKLNKASIKTVKKEFKNASDIKPIILSTTPIGRDKVLQVIEISGERLLIGVSQNSVNLIKTLNKQEKTEENVKKEDNKENSFETKVVEKKPINEDDFGLYKKYLR